VGEMDYNYGSRYKDWRWIKENIPNNYGIMVWVFFTNFKDGGEAR
jgi:hypothetical protein